MLVITFDWLRIRNSLYQKIKLLQADLYISNMPGQYANKCSDSNMEELLPALLENYERQTNQPIM